MLWRLLRTVSVSHLQSERIKGALTLLGMALGIAVFAGIRFASQNVYRSFETSVEILSGPQNLTVTGTGGRVDENRVADLWALDSIEQLIPVSERRLLFADAQRPPVTLVATDVLQLNRLGASDPSETPPAREAFLDLLAEPNAVAVSESLHRSLPDPENISVLAGARTKTLKAAFTLQSQSLNNLYGGRVVFMDIANYQNLFRDFGKVDRLLVVTPPGIEPEALAQDIQNVSNGRLQLVVPETQAAQGRKMTEAFNLNLQFLACIALFVGVLLIYNSVSYAVLKRRRELGILMSLGVKPRTLFAQIAMESVAIGLLAAVLGIVLGYGLSLINVKFMVGTISNLYFPVDVGNVQWDLRVIIECLVLGPLMALLGCLLPCWEVFIIPLRESFHYQNWEAKFRRWVPRLALAGVGFFVLAYGFSQTFWLKFSILIGFVGPVFWVLGFVCLTPVFLQACLKGLRRLLKRIRHLAALLAVDHMMSTLQRNSVAVAAAMIAIGMYLGMATMIVSFRGTVDQWIHQVTQADVFLSTPYGVGGREGGYLPEALVSALAQHPAVAEYDWTTSREVVWEDRRIRVNGVRLNSLAEHDRLLFKKSLSDTERAALASDPDALLVSETFSNRFGVDIGDAVTVPGVEDASELTVDNIFYDYTSEHGVLLVPFERYAAWFGDSRKEGMALYLKSGSDAEAIRNWISENFPDLILNIRANSTLRREVMDIFDQTFQITQSLQWMTLLIAGFTLLNTLLMLTLERLRELGVLRALGAQGRLLKEMVLHESFFLAGCAFGGGAAVGLVLSLVLVFVINKFFFGWSVVFSYHWPALFSTAAGTALIALAAGLVPASRLVKRLDTQALRYE